MLRRAVFQNVKSVHYISRQIVLIRNVSNSSTVDMSEIHHFKKFSEECWNEAGIFKPLHSMNKLRVPLIRDGLINTNLIPQEVLNGPTPLKDLLVLDVGCGGGILSEPLARIGANVTGLDANCDLIDKAKLHASAEKLQNIQYVCSTIEEHADCNSEKYDAVVASEVVEHVTEKEHFLKSCVKCLKPGGSLFLTTLNKTCYANFGAILLGENILQLLPRGTHEYNKFIQPHKLQRMLEDENCKILLTHGFLYNFLTDDWSWSSFKDINYGIHAVKLQLK